ncbi:MAG: ribbon-helix-helix domain-containing protein [Acidimicrobiales bacterium]
MTQFVTRVDDDLARAVDGLVASGVVGSRSEAVRVGLTTLVDRNRRRLVGNQIALGYKTTPQTDDELAGLDEMTRALIAGEPW